MAAAKKKPTRAQRAIAIEDMNPTQLLAHEILEDYGDLAPSVRRIMEAELTDDERHDALTLFRSSLGNLDDPNRDPRVAIVNSSSGVSSG